MAEGNPLPNSPMVWEFRDFEGRVLRITVAYNNSTRRIGTTTVFRQVGCLFRRIYWDLGPDGTPDTSTRTVTVPNGTTSLTRAQLTTATGLDVVEDILDVNFTVGP